MPTIIHIESGKATEVASQPRYEDGVWECGDHRFVDPDGTIYKAGPAPLPKMSALAFYQAFTPKERVAIKASADPLVQELWGAYEMAKESGSEIDPNLASIADGLAYLAKSKIIANARVAQIQQGIPQ